MSQIYNVLVSAEMKGISEDAKNEMVERLEEHGLEKIPTVSDTWEMSCEAEDESDAKDQAIQAFTNVVRTYPFELGLVVQCGTGQIIRRRKKFEP